MKIKPLPKEVFVWRNADGATTPDETFLSVEEEIALTAEKGQIRRVGRYVLAEESDVSVTVMTTIVKAPKRREKK